MASKRSVPTNLFWDETFSSFCGDTQSIFIGLLLSADDHGRGPASVSVLTRMLAKPSDVLSTALEELHTHAFIQRYQAEGKAYYAICRWAEWERLDKPARSQYPAPPCCTTALSSENTEDSSDVSRESADFPGKAEDFSEKRSEAEAEENRREAEEKADRPGETVIPFPTRHGSGGTSEEEEETISDPLVQKLATILRLPASSALMRLVNEFQDLALLGEADAALAWLASQEGKRTRRQTMTLPFFRRWLQRSRTMKQHDQPTMLQATGTTGRPAPRLPSLMNLDQERTKGKPHR